jgi:hypothetical protein
MTIQQRYSILAVGTLTLLPLFLAGCREPHLGRRIGGEAWSCGGLIVLILAIYAIVNILQSDADTGSKVLWTLLVFFLPLVGFIIWLFFGPRKR